MEREDKNAGDKLRHIPVLKSYTVFNVVQCEGLEIADDSATTEPFERLADADAFIAAIGATVEHGGDRAYYSPSRDVIVLPPPESFEAPEYYYATSLHEHSHLSGAKHRLAREFGKRFGDAAYAFEELVVRRVGAIERRGDLSPG
jgi:antirestriction protein ArdC